VLASLGDVDVVLFVVEAGRFGLDDAKVLALLPGQAVLLVANKLDAVRRRADMLPWLKGMQERHAFAEFVPMSATRDADVQRLFGIVEPHLPEQAWFYDEDALTDRSERFLASEMIREKLFRLTGDELPYTSTVVIDKFEEEGNGAASRPPSSSSATRTRAWSSARAASGSSASAARRAGAREAARRQGLPRAVGQGALGLGRRRGPPAQLRLRVSRRRPSRRASSAAPLSRPMCCTATTGARPA
jgi:hypothetical protein